MNENNQEDIVNIKRKLDFIVNSFIAMSKEIKSLKEENEKLSVEVDRLYSMAAKSFY